MTLRRLTVPEHRALGAELAEARSTVLRATVELEARYGRSSTVAAAIGKTLAAFDELRCVLDDRLHRDHDLHDLSVYFPRRRAS